MARKRADEMATDTQEIAAETNGATEGTSKRKRVDVEALAASSPDEKVILSLAVPAGMRLALRKAAESANVSEMQFIRDILAQRMEYSVPASFNERSKRTGRFSGLTEEQKKAAIAAESETKRQNVQKLLELIASGTLATPEALAAAGIDVSALPKPRSKKEEAVTA